MSSTSRVAIRYTPELVKGTTPSSPAYQTIRRVGFPNFDYKSLTVESEEVRSDGQVSDRIQVGKEASGEFDSELSFGTYDELLAGVLLSSWTNTPTLVNVTADSVITGVTDSSDTYTVSSGGAAFKAGHICRASDFTNTNNNRVFRVASSTATTVVGSSLTLTDESAPPAGARLRVVGFEGASGDINATSTGLSSTSLDFTTLGLVAGMWVKIGGSATANKFVTTGNSGYARISSIAARAINFSALPTGWSSETGTGLKIQVWFGDYARNATTVTSYTFERSFEDHSPVTYQYFTGMVPNGFSMEIPIEEKIKCKFNFQGMGSDMTNTRTSGATTLSATTTKIMNGSTNVAVIMMDNAAVGSFVSMIQIDINNNFNRINAVGYDYTVDFSEGVKRPYTGKIGVHFKDKTLYSKMLSDAETAISSAVKSDDGVILFDMPRVKFSEAPMSDSDGSLVIEYAFQALLHATLGYTFHAQRFHYVE
jgi:hypothetical protein